MKGGYAVTELNNVKQKHLTYLAQRWEEDGLAASTLQTRWSVLKLCFNTWLKKGGFVKPIQSYLKDPSRAERTYIAQADKSWSAKVDTEQQILRVMAEDKIVGDQLMMMWRFGLRRKEAIMFKPHMNDLGKYISVTDGTKGGRTRIVPVETEQQRELLDRLKESVRGHKKPLSVIPACGWIKT
jgi:integrase